MVFGVKYAWSLKLCLIMSFLVNMMSFCYGRLHELLVSLKVKSCNNCFMFFFLVFFNSHEFLPPPWFLELSMHGL